MKRISKKEKRQNTLRSNLIFNAIIIGLLLLTAGLLIQCQSITAETIKGNGKISQEQRKLSEFKAIDVSGFFEVIVIPADTQKVVLICDENLFEHIKTDVKAETLKIYTNCNIRNVKRLSVEIYTPLLESIEASGTCNIFYQGTIKTENFNMDLSGASEAKILLQAKQSNIEASGACNITLIGSAHTNTIDMSGASSLNAANYVTNTTEIEISGTGDAKINASTNLISKISGVGSVWYVQEPSGKKEINISGMGTIKKL